MHNSTFSVFSLLLSSYMFRHFHLQEAYTNVSLNHTSINSVKWTCIFPTYIQQDATLHSLFYLETALHVSGGATTHHQESKQLYLQHPVFVTPLLLPAAIAEELELVWVCCRWRMPPTAHSVLCLTTSTNNTSKLPFTYEKPAASSAVLGFWWWAVCRPKHVELHINME